MNRIVSCWQCGADLPDPEARFCPACGAMLSKPTFAEQFRQHHGWLWIVLALVVVAAAVFVFTTVLPSLRAAESGEPTPMPTLQATVPAAASSAVPTDTPMLAPTITPTAQPTLEPTAEPEPTGTVDLDAALLEAANRFQEAKAYSQATGDTSQLGDALAGDALARQIELVESYRDRNCSWEITLDAPLTVRVLETRDDNWARIEVGKVETRLLTCDGTLQSEIHGDAYTTTYLVELIDGVWLITQRE